jgi:regulator of protease activity HflC (stomatin/prohibitin superfamily)
MDSTWIVVLSGLGGVLIGIFTNPRFIDLVLAGLERAQPFVVVNSWAQGIILRWGAGKKLSPGGHPYHRVVNPGFHWVVPFMDDTTTVAVVTESMTYTPQVFVSSQGTAYLCQFHALYHVDDLVVYQLDVQGTEDVMVDAIAGTLRKIIAGMTDAELTTENLEQRLTERARARAKRFGIYMERVYVSELVPMGFRQGVIRLAGSQGATL